MKLTQFSPSDLPIITDEHFWIINLPKYNDLEKARLFAFQHLR